MRETFFLPDDDVPETAVRVVLAYVISQPLVENVTLVLPQLPLGRAVQMNPAVGQRGALDTVEGRGGCRAGQHTMNNLCVYTDMTNETAMEGMSRADSLCVL